MYFYNDNNYYDATSNITSASDSDSDESQDDTSIIIDLYNSGQFNSDSESEYDNESDYHTDLDMNTDDGIEYDSIHVEDSEHFYSEKVDKQYYIGLSHIYNIKNTNYLMLSTTVSPQVFFKHSYDNINNYLYYYGLTRIPNHQVQVLQVDIIQEDGFEIVTVINKTYWLRLLQRHWKKIYKQRKTIIQQRILPENLFYNQVNGKYPINTSYLPSLYGMLSQYKK